MNVKGLKKILLLHGSGGAGSKYRSRCIPLIEALGCEFIIPDGLFPKDDGYSWWQFATPTERSYNAKELLGVQDSINLINDILDKEDNLDFVMGHSQGAMLLVITSLTPNNEATGVAIVLSASATPPTTGILENAFPKTPIVIAPAA